MSRQFFITLFLIILLSLSSFLLLPEGPLDNQIYVAICFATFFSQIAALVYFLRSLRVFKQQLRIAYRILAIGILVFSLPAFILPASSMVELDPLALSSYVVASSLVGALLMYVAVRRFSKILQIRSLLTSSLFAFGLAIVLALLSSLLPHVEFLYDEPIIDAIFAGYIAAGTFSAVSALIVLKIRTKLGQLYKTSMAWLAAALFFAAFACLHETLTKLLPVFSEEFFNNYFIYAGLWPFLGTAILFLQASISFRTTSARLIDIPEETSSVEVVSHIARMASDPSSIDTALDTIREISSVRGAGSKLTAADEARVRNVYLQIEEYLTTKEPLRQYTVEDLRSQLPEKFRQTLS